MYKPVKPVKPVAYREERLGPCFNKLSFLVCPTTYSKMLGRIIKGVDIVLKEMVSLSLLPMAFRVVLVKN